MGRMLGIFLILCVLRLYGVSGADAARVSLSVMEGDSATLHTDVEINQKDRIKWFFKNTRIAQIIGNISNCTDVQCNKGTETFIGRLKLDDKTGSLTIRDIRTTDTGVYELQITSSISNTDNLKTFNVTVSGTLVSVSVMEGDSVTLHSDVQTNQQVRWYFNDTRIAQINGDQSKICTDVQCNEGTERFRDRLKLDHQTGSLTITNITTEHAGVYHLQISSNDEKIFSVAVHGVPAAEQNEIKSVKEGESVTLDPGVVKNPNDVMTWYFNEILITEITGDQSQICTDDQCKDGNQGFRDRLKVNQSQSLTITNTRTTDTGLYKLQINSSRIGSSYSFRRIKNFSVAVFASGPPAVARSRVVLLVAVAVVAAAAAFAVVTAGVIYYRKQQARRSRMQKNPNEKNGVHYSTVKANEDSCDTPQSD